MLRFGFAIFLSVIFAAQISAQSIELSCKYHWSDIQFGLLVDLDEMVLATGFGTEYQIIDLSETWVFAHGLHVYGLEGRSVMWSIFAINRKTGELWNSDFNDACVDRPCEYEMETSKATCVRGF